MVRLKTIGRPARQWNIANGSRRDGDSSAAGYS
jgi:hypothetical protein